MTHHTQGCPVVHCPSPGRTTPRISTVLLLGWGLLASRAAGSPWGRAVRIGCADVLLGVAVALVSTLLK